MNSREKQLSIQQLQYDSLETLHVPEVRARLGEYALRLNDVVVRSRYAPVDSDDFLDVKETQPSLVPVVARHMGERAVLHARDSGMNAHQIEALGRDSDPAIARAHAQSLDRYFQMNNSHGVLGEVNEWSEIAAAGSNYRLRGDELTFGRPYVSMNMNARMNGRFSPVVFLHEATHILQREANPVRSADLFQHDNIRNELEAYHISAQIILGYTDAGKQAELLAHTSTEMLDQTLRIEEVRARYQTSKDPFTPSEAVVQGMFDSELGITHEMARIIEAERNK